MKLRTLIILIIVCASLGFSEHALVWQKMGYGIYESDVEKLAVHPTNDSHIYAGTSRAVYQSIDAGKSYQMVLRLSGEMKGVNDIFIPAGYPESVYVGTNAGLFESSDEGRTWEKIYFASDEASRQCLSVIRDDDRVYCGTTKGLFYKSDLETRWIQFKEGLDDKPIYDMAADGHFLYLATDQAVFRLERNNQKIQKIYSLGIGKETEEMDPLEENFINGDGGSIRSLSINDCQKPHLIVASDQSIDISLDEGMHWETIPTSSLAIGDLTSLAVFENASAQFKNDMESQQDSLALMAGTKRGAFFFDNGKWMPVYQGMETNRVNCLAKNAKGDIYAATDKGIFYLSFGKALSFSNERNAGQLTAMTEVPKEPEHWPEFDFEPTINEAHQMAINYAEVSSEKIKTWRTQARRKAWFPKLSVGVDSDRDWSSSDSIWGSYTGGGLHYVGPDDKTRGENIGWDASLSWDLSGLIWSTDQTTIDSRSKLMVELREDILNEITRLYFERRRTQWDLALDESADWRIKAEREMRVAELTALIDALTGGGFSKHIDQMKTIKDFTNSHEATKGGKNND
ncbi:MAG: hypothetical protein JW847_00625 [Candidatus Omnitrophica bacterium]|nr:hypothetical protein [Candidatus Omnitrophota bacterium]